MDFLKSYAFIACKISQDLNFSAKERALQQTNKEI